MNTPSLQYLGKYFHTYYTSLNNPAGLQPKIKLPCFQESKDASSLTFPNFFSFLETDSADMLHFCQAFNVFFHRAMTLRSQSPLYSQNSLKPSLRSLPGVK